MEISTLSKFEEQIGYHFNNKQYLKIALTHPSYQNNNFQNFEFLGDRIIGSIISKILFDKNIEIKETAKQYTNLINTEALAKVAIELDIQFFLNHKIENLSNKLLADVVEALIAAIYLDSNYEQAYHFVENIYKTILIKDIDKLDFKTQLQEISLSKKLGTPIYEMIKEEEILKKKTYTMKVTIGKFSAIATNSSKHEATKNAAQILFNRLK